MSFEVGQMAGDYQVLDRIGQGGMGTVYKVRHAISDRVEAMKVLLPDLNAAEDLEDRFLREIKVQASLSHPNIASLHTAFRYKNQLLMVMEFIEGESLSVAMKTHGLTIGDSVRYARDVLSALGYAHGIGVVHRDIKPQNIMITLGGQVKLLDFGLAIAAKGKTMTRTGAVMGSILYMSPEQVNGLPADGRSDIYSMGITLYQLVTGVTAIPGESDFQIMNGHLNYSPVPPVQINPGVPPHVSAAIMRALAKSAADRFQTAEDFSAALSVGETMWMPPQATAQTSAIDPELVERAAKILAHSIGPIARVLVKREMKSATDWPSLRERLAAEIASPAEREKFLSATK